MAQQCHSTGAIGSEGGGIFGYYAAQDNGAATAVDCWSEGTIGVDAGGIFGAYASKDYGAVIARNCYSTGSIGEQAGGIFGFGAGRNGGNATAEKCYSTGNIAIRGGGILGRQAAYDGRASAVKCYSTGNIDTSGGGIFGFEACTCNSNGSPVSARALHCYSRGTVGTDAGGIFGAYAGQNDFGVGNNSNVYLIASNCYSYGTLGTNAGGIVGDKAGCDTSNPAVFRITNCYVARGSAIYGPNSCVSNYCVCATSGSWSDATAASVLIGPAGSTPSIWKSATAGTPWLLELALTTYRFVAQNLTVGNTQLFSTAAVDAFSAGGAVPANTPVTLTNGTLFRRLGRFRFRMGTRRLISHRFEQVQIIASRQTGWVCTWAAAGTPPVTL
jgi:hypothetical protein